jgi:hypothetical protein
MLFFYFRRRWIEKLDIGGHWTVNILLLQKLIILKYPFLELCTKVRAQLAQMHRKIILILLRELQMLKYGLGLFR